MIASVATRMPIVAAFVVFVVMFSSLSLVRGWRYLLDFRYLTEIVSESLPDAPKFGRPLYFGCTPRRERRERGQLSSWAQAPSPSASLEEHLIASKTPVEPVPTFEEGGVSLYYERAGSQGEPIVLCHGIPTDHRAWRAQVEPFSKDHPVITYSRRYAAPNQRTGDLADSTVENNAADLERLIEGLGIAPVHLVGHSYGGFISADVAANHPDLVRSLILVEPAIATLLVENPESAGQMLSLLLRSPSVALSARRFQSRSLRPSLKALDSGENEKAVQLSVDGVQDRTGAFASMPEPVKGMMLDNARTIAELRTRFPPFKSKIQGISCKTLVLNGSEGALWLRRIGELTASSVQRGVASQVTGSRHFPHVENPAEFNSKALAFITGP
jgi:non-heme chloroperoxidase